MSKPLVFKLGTAVKISSRINENTATAATVTLKDPNDNVVTGVNAAAMTKEANKYYMFVWQSTEYDDGGVEGTYTAIVKITIGSYTGVTQIEFGMERTA